MKTNFTLIFILIPFFLLSQELKFDDSGAVTDGEVTCMKSYGDSLIVGGRFNYLGVHTGSLVALDSSSSSLTDALSKVYGRINSIINDGSNGFYVCGEFNKIGNINISNLAHFKSDLSLDMNFQPNPNGQVKSAVINNNKLIVVGDFTSIGATPRNRIGEVDKVTGGVTLWNPSINGTITSLIKIGGKFYIAGSFTSVNNFSLSNFAAFDTTGNSLISSISPNPNGFVNRIIPHGDRLYLIGQFTHVAGNPRNRVAAISSNGDLHQFSPFLQSNEYPSDIMAFQNKILISITSGSLQPFVNQYDTSTSANTIFLNNITTDGTEIKFGGYITDKMYLTVNGNFYSTNFRRCRLLVVNPITGMVYSDGRAFNLNGNLKSVIEYNNKIILGGDFSSTHGKNATNIGIVNTSTNSVLDFKPDFGSNITNSIINDVETFPNAIVAVGKITGNNGSLNHGRIWRFNSSGQNTKTMLTYLSNNANGTEVTRVKLIDNSLFVYGNFDQIDNTNGRPRIAKIDTSLTIISYFPAPGHSNTLDNAQVRIFDITGYNGNVIFTGGKIFNMLGGINISNFYPVYMLNNSGGFVRSLTSSTIMDYFNKSIIFGDTIYSIYNAFGSGGIRSTIIANNTNISNYSTNSNNALTTFDLYKDKIYYAENVGNSGNPYMLLKSINRSNLTGVLTIDTIGNQTNCFNLINNKLFIGGGTSHVNSQTDMRQGIRSYIILAKKPTLPSSSLTVSNLTNTSATLTWNPGSGDGRIVVVKPASYPNSLPVSGISYTANVTFGLGSRVLDSSFVVYNGTGNTVQINGLQPNKSYQFAVFEYNGLGNSINYLTSGVVYVNGTTLPVTLVSFNAKEQSGKALLTWVTSTEINNSHFEVERSIDGVKFTKVGEVAGSGNSNTVKTYRFVDELTNAKVTYYRLKQVDFNGAFEYSNIINLTTKALNALSSMSVYPNPATNSISVDGLTEQALVYDAVGRLVLTVSENGLVDVSHLTPGVYFVKTSNETVKFVKQ